MKAPPLDYTVFSSYCHVSLLLIIAKLIEKFTYGHQLTSFPPMLSWNHFNQAFVLTYVLKLPVNSMLLNSNDQLSVIILHELSEAFFLQWITLLKYFLQFTYGMPLSWLYDWRSWLFAGCQLKSMLRCWKTTQNSLPYGHLQHGCLLRQDHKENLWPQGEPSHLHLMSFHLIKSNPPDDLPFD